MNWDLIQTLYTLIQKGTLSEAAKTLCVDPTTVSRRLASLEKDLGMRLFEKKGTRYVPTKEGDIVYKKAKAMSDLVSSLESLASFQHEKIRGTVRITTLESLIMDFLVPNLPTLKERYPDLHIQFLSSDQNLSLMNRETDIAIRLAKPDLVNIVVKKIANVGFSVYAAAHIDQDWTDFCKKNIDWVTYVDEYSRLTEAKWMTENMLKPEPVLKSSDAGVLKMAIKVGLGVGFLPCFRGDPDNSLIRISGPEPIVTREAWLLAPAGYMSNPAVRAAMEWLDTEFQQNQSLFAGVRS